MPDPKAEKPEALTIVALGSIITIAFMGSVIVTPLYPLYQEKFGFSEITLTLIYAVYVVGNVTALLLFGQISDQVGRKRVALPALGLAGVSALLFLFASGTGWLFAGRLFIGLAVGILSGTGTAWLAERYGPDNRSTATVASSTANLTGIAIGPLMAGLLAQYAPGPLHLTFVVYLVLLALVAITISRTADPPPARAVRLREVRVHPRVGVPADRLRSFIAPAVTGFATFAVGGLYFSLIPGILIRDLNEDNLALAGLIVFELAAIATVLISLGRRLRPSTAMNTGLICLLPAVALIVIAQAAQSLPLLLVATGLAGVPLALGYRGSLEVVNEIAPEDRRAEVVSSYFIACFSGNALPVIGVGVLTTVTTPLTAGIVFASTLGVLAIAALLWFRRDLAS